MRIIYACPIGNRPSGGVKVIYRHSEILNDLGIDSFILHPGEPSFRCDWFNNSAKMITENELKIASDLIIIPEIWASFYVDYFKSKNFKVGIFVQNAYYTHVNLNHKNDNAILDAYKNSDIILSISNDTSLYIEEILKVDERKIHLTRYSIDTSLFRPGNKKKNITYMPRKMEQHSQRFISAVSNMLPPDWRIIPLDGLKESEVAKNLSESIIFVAFSEFEGLPVPPVEAALSGNIVIGYHGQGGREYWDAPNFISVEQGDIQGLIFEVSEKIKEFETAQINLEAINNGMKKVASYFSKEQEIYFLTSFVNFSSKMF